MFSCGVFAIEATCDIRSVMQAQERFRNAYQEVKITMAQLYSFFQADSEEVQREWLKFTQKVCFHLLPALRTILT